MLFRIWKVNLAQGQAQALETFANAISLPMFRQQAGCLGVFFTRTDSECATVTVWESAEAIAALEASESYQQVVRQIEKSGILGDNHDTQVFSVYGGFVTPELAAQLMA